jgi:hypothetical protein
MFAIHNTLSETYDAYNREIKKDTVDTQMISESKSDNRDLTATFASTINTNTNVTLNTENSPIPTINTVNENQTQEISINTPDIQTDNVTYDKTQEISINTPDNQTDNVTYDKTQEISINTPDNQTDNVTYDKTQEIVTNNDETNTTEKEVTDISTNTPENDETNTTEKEVTDISTNTPENDKVDESSPFYSFTKKELQDECETRGLSTSGTKVSLIERLVTDEITKNN